MEQLQIYNFDFDAVYVALYPDSKDFARGKSVQDFSQIAMDFEVEHHVLSSMLVVASMEVENCDVTRKSMGSANLLYT
ncbi:MAG: hypothetical protein V2I33_17925 [Kangiellaceae bacterium]|nr:hypothetical protein [Kangiellaceae bacterium]